MALLKAEPPDPIRSLRELFAVAHRLECNAEAAGVFERLAEEKRGHAARVERWAKERTGTTPEPLAARWEPQSMFDEEAAEDTPPHRLATPYRALSLAVRQEDRAF